RREQYAVALALVRDGKVELGVLGCPELNIPLSSEEGAGNATPQAAGYICIAARNRGSWCQPLSNESNWQKLTASPRSQSNTARILRSVEKSHTNVDEISQLAAKLGTSEKPVGMDSQAKYAVLAAGEGDIMLRLLSPARPDYREKIWDQAAGSIVVEEAGGRITDLDGKSLDFSHGRTLAKNRGVIATNGHLHEAVLGTLRRLGV
ncbi:MAG TPA: inositol monophosphatase family protein, partial [Lacipirellulaceae bacterium]|nr:inositol monophosphatase family protein [Lacipirellulaceae bacterium]